VELATAWLAGTSSEVQPPDAIGSLCISSGRHGVSDGCCCLGRQTSISYIARRRRLAHGGSVVSTPQLQLDQWIA
jgi:hypothetical protein